MAFIMEAFDNRVLRDAVHALGLPLDSSAWCRVLGISVGADVFVGKRPEHFACRHRVLDEGNAGTTSVRGVDLRLLSASLVRHGPKKAPK